MTYHEFTYDTIREDVYIEDGKLIHNMRALYRVPKGQNDLEPAYASFYYNKDENGFCTPITEDEYYTNTIYSSLPVTPPLSSTVEVVNPAPIVPTNMIYPTATSYYMFSPTYNTLNNFRFPTPPIVPVTHSTSPDTNGTGENKDCNITGINGNFSLKILYRNFYISHTSTGTNKKITFTMEITTTNNIFHYEVAGNDCTDPHWISVASDHKAYLVPGKKSLDAFVQYMLSLTSDTSIPEAYIFNNCGWEIINEKPCYIYADGAIGAEIPNVFGNPMFHICFDASKVGSPEIFNSMKKILNVTHDPKISSTLLLFLHIGILTGLFTAAKFPVKFLLGILGQTNSRKTSLAMAILRLFNTDDPTPEVSFSSTPGGLEIMMSQYADAILVIDDYMPATNRSRQNVTDNKFDDITRRAGDRTVKHRMLDFSGEQNANDYPARGCYVITGEQMHGVQSALARTVVVNLSKDEVNNDVLQYFQDNVEIIPTHLVDFIQYVASHYWQIVDHIHQTLPFYRRNMNTHIARLAEAFSTFAVACDIFCSYISEREFMSNSEISELKNFLISNVKQLILQNDLQFIASDPGILILTALSDAILSESCHLVSRFNYTTKADVILEDDEVYYIRSETAYLITKNYCARYDIPIALINPKAVIPALEQINVLVISPSSKERARKLPNNQKDSRRYLYISKDAMKRVLSDSEEREANK